MPAPKDMASALESARVLGTIRAAGRALDTYSPMICAEARVGDEPEYCARLAWILILAERPRGPMTLGEQMLRAALTTAAVLPDGPTRPHHP